MGFLCVLSFLTYFDRLCIMRAQPMIETDLHITHAQMGVIFGVFWLAYALFELPGGWMGDRFGARSTLTRVVLAWSLFTALSGTATGFFSLLTLRFLFGVGEAGAYPNIARVQSRWLPASAQGRASGILWLVARWGGALSPLLFGMLMREFDSPGFRSLAKTTAILRPLVTLQSWRLGFFACGFAGLVWVAFFFPWFHDNPADHPSVNEAELSVIGGGKPIKPHATRDGKVWLALVSSPSLWGLSMVYVFGSFGWSFFVSWMPKFLLDVHHISFKDSEWMSAMPMLCGGVTCLIGGFVSDAIVKRTGRKRFGRAVFPVVGHVIAAVAIFGLRYVHTPLQAVVLMSVTMAAYDLGLGAKWAAIIDIGGVHSGIAAGFVNMLGNLGGNTLQPIIGAMIFHRWGWGTLFTVYSAMYLLAAAMYLFIHPDHVFYEEDADRAA
jgi:sugar phosphate permease